MSAGEPMKDHPEDNIDSHGVIAFRVGRLESTVERGFQDMTDRLEKVDGVLDEMISHREQLKALITWQTATTERMAQGRREIDAKIEDNRKDLQSQISGVRTQLVAGGTAVILLLLGVITDIVVRGITR